VANEGDGVGIGCFSAAGVVSQAVIAKCLGIADGTGQADAIVGNQDPALALADGGDHVTDNKGHPGRVIQDQFSAIEREPITTAVIVEEHAGVAVLGPDITLQVQHAAFGCCLHDVRRDDRQDDAAFPSQLDGCKAVGRQTQQALPHRRIVQPRCDALDLIDPIGGQTLADPGFIKALLHQKPLIKR
jgi:hypothetical protein